MTGLVLSVRCKLLRIGVEEANGRLEAFLGDLTAVNTDLRGSIEGLGDASCCRLLIQGAQDNDGVLEEHLDEINYLIFQHFGDAGPTSVHHSALGKPGVFLFVIDLCLLEFVRWAGVGVGVGGGDRSKSLSQTNMLSQPFISSPPPPSSSLLPLPVSSRPSPRQAPRAVSPSHSVYDIYISHRVCGWVVMIGSVGRPAGSKAHTWPCVDAWV